jgi:hypothetical protein
MCPSLSMQTLLLDELSTSILAWLRLNNRVEIELYTTQQRVATWSGRARVMKEEMYHTCGILQQERSLICAFTKQCTVQ